MRRILFWVIPKPFQRAPGCISSPKFNILPIVEYEYEHRTIKHHQTYGSVIPVSLFSPSWSFPPRANLWGGRGLREKTSISSLDPQTAVFLISSYQPRQLHQTSCFRKQKAEKTPLPPISLSRRIEESSHVSKRGVWRSLSECTPFFCTPAVVFSCFGWGGGDGRFWSIMLWHGSSIR